MSKDYYEILGISRNATEEEIKAAYRRLAKIYHPDVAQNKQEAEKKFKEINEAFQVLIDPEKRKLYDKYGTIENIPTSSNYSSSVDIFDIFSDIFNDFVFNTERKYREYNPLEELYRPQRGKDITFNLEITLEDSYFGKKQKIKVPYKKVCPTCSGLGFKKEDLVKCDKCKGTGKVTYKTKSVWGTVVSTFTCDQCNGWGYVPKKICSTCNGNRFIHAEKEIEIEVPRGVENGDVILIAAEGNEGLNGGRNGDLYIRINIKEHPFLKRKNGNLMLEYPISFIDAILGASVKVPHINGYLEVDIPAGIQPGEEIIIKNQGMPIKNSSKKGDFVLKIKVIIPKKLSPEQTKALESIKHLFSTIEKEENKKSFFEKIFKKK